MILSCETHCSRAVAHIYPFYEPASTSPCKDTGENASLPPDAGDLDWDANTVEPVPYDLGLAGRNVGISVDMGAYEIPAPQAPPEQ